MFRHILKVFQYLLHGFQGLPGHFGLYALKWTLREKCPYSEFFWSVFSHICTEYGEILRVSPYSVRMRENTDQKNS